MQQAPTPPQPHFPSRYARPSVAPTIATNIATKDGAHIATFIYESTGSPQKASAASAHLPVLMLHGNGEEHGIFGPTIDALVASGYRVIALDSRAQGKSTRGSSPLTYELLTADALAVLDAHAVEKVHVLGFSDGAIEALLLARDYPTRVASIVAMGANLTPEGVMSEPDWDIAELVGANRAWATYWRHAANHNGDKNKFDTSMLTPTPEEANNTADLLQLMLDEPHISPSSLTNIMVPTTVMVGEFDCIADYETCAIAGAIPKARLVVVPGAGHTLPKHAPGTVTRELLSTIASAEHGMH